MIVVCQVLRLLIWFGVQHAFLQTVKGESSNVAEWPKVFQAEFVSGRLGKRTTGFFWSTEHAERIDLSDGSHDHLCAYSHVNTACTQLTTEGTRFLWFPEMNECCKCCSYRQESPYPCGGPLSRNWVKQGEYLGQVTVKTQSGDNLCHKWRINGLSKLCPNFYLQAVDTGLPCEIDGCNYLFNPLQTARDQYIFNPKNMSSEVDESVFQVPQVCRDAKPCATKVCDSKLNTTESDLIVFT